MCVRMYVGIARTYGITIGVGDSVDTTSAVAAAVAASDRACRPTSTDVPTFIRAFVVLARGTDRPGTGSKAPAGPA